MVTQAESVCVAAYKPLGCIQTGNHVGASAEGRGCSEGAPPAAPAANSAPPTPRFAPCAGLAASSSLAVCPPSARRSAPCFWLLVAHATKELN